MLWTPPIVFLLRALRCNADYAGPGPHLQSSFHLSQLGTVNQKEWWSAVLGVSVDGPRVHVSRSIKRRRTFLLMRNSTAMVASRVLLPSSRWLPQ